MSADDFEAALDFSLVVVRHLQDEQIFKDIAVDHEGNGRLSEEM